MVFKFIAEGALIADEQADRRPDPGAEASIDIDHRAARTDRRNRERCRRNPVEERRHGPGMVAEVVAIGRVEIGRHHAHRRGQSRPDHEVGAIRLDFGYGLVQRTNPGFGEAVDLARGKIDPDEGTKVNRSPPAS